MNVLDQELQPKLDRLLQLLVEAYDKLSVRLVAEKFPLEMTRALLPVEHRKNLLTKDDLGFENVSGHEGHCIGNGYAWGDHVLSGSFSEAGKLGEIAKKFIQNCSDTNIADFNRVASYMRLQGLKIGAELRGATLEWPDETGLVDKLLFTRCTREL